MLLSKTGRIEQNYFSMCKFVTKNGHLLLIEEDRKINDENPNHAKK